MKIGHFAYLNKSVSLTCTPCHSLSYSNILNDPPSRFQFWPSPFCKEGWCSHLQEGERSKERKSKKVTATQMFKSPVDTSHPVTTHLISIIWLQTLQILYDKFIIPSQNISSQFWGHLSRLVHQLTIFDTSACVPKHLSSCIYYWETEIILISKFQSWAGLKL